MNAFQYCSKIFLLFISFLVAVNLLCAQDSKKEETKNIIEAQRFVFKAQTAIPNRGRMVQLTSEYDVVVSKDTLRSYLPYFGRAYSAPMNRTGSGIDFISTNFEYIQKPRKKGGWEISIKPKDVTDVRLLIMSVFANGSSSLQVFSNNRETISFYGQLAENKRDE